MYYPIKAGCKKKKNQQFSGYMVETVISDYISLHCDLELEDKEPIFLHNTLAQVDASPYQVWLQKVQQLRRYLIQMKVHWNFEPFLSP